MWPSLQSAGILHTVPRSAYPLRPASNCHSTGLCQQSAAGSSGCDQEQRRSSCSACAGAAADAAAHAVKAARLTTAGGTEYAAAAAGQAASSSGGRLPLLLLFLVVSSPHEHAVQSTCKSIQAEDKQRQQHSCWEGKLGALLQWVLLDIAMLYRCCHALLSCAGTPACSSGRAAWWAL